MVDRYAIGVVLGRPQRQGVVDDDTLVVNAVISKKLECEPLAGVHIQDRVGMKPCGAKPVLAQFVHSHRV